MKNMITAIIDTEQKYCHAVSNLWQYDYGQILRIQGVTLPAAVEVQFSLTERKSGQDRSRSRTKHRMDRKKPVCSNRRLQQSMDPLTGQRKLQKCLILPRRHPRRQEM